MAASESEYEQVTSEEFFKVPKKDLFLSCCDCHLVHVVNYKIKDGVLYLNLYRHNRATAALRREAKKRAARTQD